ncbi:MAG: radical SAM protein [Acidobacteriota bacterium]
MTEPDVGLAATRGLTLLVTGRCNLRCSYCYQGARPAAGARMPWEIARRAIELLVESAQPRLTLDLSGGEPLLEPALVHRIVAYARERVPDRRRLAIVLTTNGTRLTPELFGRLAEQDVTVRLSHDGVREAQRQRGEGTFERLDRLLVRLRAEQSSALRSHLEVVATVSAASAPYLARSVSYLLATGAGKVNVAARFTPDPEWRPEMLDVLREQADRVIEASLDLWRGERRCPVSFLEPAPHRSDPGGPGFASCGALSGRSLCVDWRGRCWPCPALADSAAQSRGRQTAASGAFLLGLLDAGIERRLEILAAAAPALAGAAERAAMRSSYGECRTCEVRRECLVCLAAVYGQDAKGGERRVPDLVCAFNQVALAARRTYHERRSGNGGAKTGEAAHGSLQEICELLRAAVAGPASPPPGR